MMKADANPDAFLSKMYRSDLDEVVSIERLTTIILTLPAEKF